MEASTLDAVARESRLGESEGFWGADVEPLAVMRDGGEPTGSDSAVPERIERELPRRPSIEEAAVDDLHAGEEMRRDLPLAPSADTTERVEEKVACTLVAEGACRALQQEQSIEARRVPGAGEAL